MSSQSKLHVHVVSDSYRMYKLIQRMQENSNAVVMDLSELRISGYEDEDVSLDEKISYSKFMYVFEKLIFSDSHSKIILKGLEGEDLEDITSIIFENLYSLKPEVHFMVYDEKTIPIELRQLCVVNNYPVSTFEERFEIFQPLCRSKIEAERYAQATEGLTLSETTLVANMVSKGVDINKAIISVKIEKLSDLGLEVLEGFPHKLSNLNTVNLDFKRKLLKILDSHSRLSLLFVGLPGQGKTFLGKALLSERYGLNLLLNASKLIESLSYKTVKRPRGAPEDILLKAIETVKPTGILIDQFDFLSAKYGLEHTVIMDRILQWLENRETGILIGTTTRPEEIDPQLIRPGRFNYVILLPLPDFATRRNILKSYGYDDITATEIASRFPYYLPADYENIAKYNSVKYSSEYVSNIKKRYMELYEFIRKLPHGIAQPLEKPIYAGL